MVFKVRSFSAVMMVLSLEFRLAAFRFMLLLAARMMLDALMVPEFWVIIFWVPSIGLTLAAMVMSLAFMLMLFTALIRPFE